LFLGQLAQSEEGQTLNDIPSPKELDSREKAKVSSQGCHRKYTISLYESSSNLFQNDTGLDPSNILLYPLNTESAMKKIEEHNTLVFIVNIRYVFGCLTTELGP
jgi:hypothetical protein